MNYKGASVGKNVGIRLAVKRRKRRRRRPERRIGTLSDNSVLLSRAQAQQEQ